ncbi:MAG: PIN domain nuclease [Chloroflexia bacterium]|nr:PIN domain nuclease [Chloroflexia bacterium]
MRGDFGVRILGMLLFGFLGLWIALGISGTPIYAEDWRYIGSLGLAGAGLGLLLTPYITIVPMRWLRGWLRTVAIEDIIAAGLGLIAGLIVSALLALPISTLPDPLGQILPFIFSVLLSYIGAAIALVRKTEVFNLFSSRRSSSLGQQVFGPLGVLVDSSAIIDGRIADICQTGFVSGPLIVPRFVLRELQRIADSDDSLRRKRGRRGLDMLNRLQKEALITVRISDLDVEDIVDVDSKLVQLARIHHCPIMTTDYNLNRVAELQGVSTLNIHELAQAVRPVVLPGEELSIQLVHEGKEYGQGVGYLDDGTMVVVEDGKGQIGQQVDIAISRLLPTSAGRIAFAYLTSNSRTAKQE